MFGPCWARFFKMVDDLEGERVGVTKSLKIPLFYNSFMNSINFSIADRRINLICHDDGYDGPGFNVVAMRTRSRAVPFARFRHFDDAEAYRSKYAAYYPFVKFYVYRTLF